MWPRFGHDDGMRNILPTTCLSISVGCVGIVARRRLAEALPKESAVQDAHFRPRVGRPQSSNLHNTLAKVGGHAWDMRARDSAEFAAMVRFLSPRRDH